MLRYDKYTTSNDYIPHLVFIATSEVLQKQVNTKSIIVNLKFGLIGLFSIYTNLNLGTKNVRARYGMEVVRACNKMT